MLKGFIPICVALVMVDGYYDNAEDPTFRKRVIINKTAARIKYSVIFCVFMLLQYVSLKEYQFPKAATLLCATPFSRSMMVLSKYIFCIVIYVACCIIFGIETLLIPGLGTSGTELFILMFFVTSVFIGIYLPIQYKLGYEKTKFAFAVIIIASPFILPMLMRMDTVNLDFFVSIPVYIVYGGVFAGGFIILALSSMLSIKIYNETDLA